MESKGGYDGIDLNSVFIRGNSELDEFLDQVTKDAQRCNRKPMLCWKRTRKPWLVFVRATDVKDFNFKYTLHYQDWIGIALDNLLELDDSFFI